MKKGGISFTNRNQIKPDDQVVTSLKSIEENKMKQSTQFSLNVLKPYLTPPTAKHRDNVYYIVSEKKYKDLIKLLNFYLKNEDIVQVTIQCFQQIIGRGVFLEKNMVNILLDTNLVEEILKCLKFTGRQAETIVMIMELLHQMQCNQQCTHKLVNLNIFPELIDILKDFHDNSKLVSLCLNIILNSSIYKHNHKKLIDHNILTEILKISFKEKIHQIIQLKTMYNFSKGEGLIELQNEYKGINKAVDIMLKNQQTDTLDLGAQLLANISSDQDFEKAIDSILQRNKDQERNLVLVNYLCILDNYLGKAKQSNIHLKLLQNIAEFGNLESHENIVSDSAIILSRLISDVNILNELMENDGFNILQNAMNSSNKQQVLFGMMQFFRQAMKFQQNKVVSTGIVEKITEVLLSNINDKQLIGCYNQMLKNLSGNKDVGDRIKTLLQIIQANKEDKEMVQDCFQNVYLIIQNSKENGQNIELLILMKQIVSAECTNWKRICLICVQIVNLLIQKDIKIKEFLSINIVQNEWRNLIISMLTNKNFNQHQRKSVLNFFQAKKQQVQEIEQLTLQEQKLYSSEAINLFQQMINDEKLADLNADLFKQIAAYNNSQIDDQAINLESRLEILSILFKIEQFDKQMNKDKVIHKLIEFSNQVLHNNNNQKLVIILNNCIFNFLKRINQRNLELDYINYINEVLQHPRTDNIQMEIILENVYNLLQNKSKIQYEDFQMKSKNQLDRLIENMVLLLKKQDDIKIQLHCFQIMRLFSQDERLVDKLIEEGAVRICINKLNNESTEQAVGIECIQLLESLGLTNINNLNQVYEAVQQFCNNSCNINSKTQQQYIQQFIIELIKTNHRICKESQQQQSNLTFDQTIIVSHETLIDINAQIEKYIKKLEEHSSLQENIYMFNMLNMIQLMNDYNDILLDKKVIEVYLDNIYQQLILDENELGLQGQISDYVLSLSLALKNIVNFIESSQVNHHERILQQLLRNEAVEVFIETITTKNHHSSILVTLIDLLIILLTHKSFFKLKDILVPKLISNEIPNLLIELTDNTQEQTIISSSYQLLCLLLSYDSSCISFQDQQNIIKKAVAIITDYNFQSGFTILHDMFDDHKQLIHSLNVQSLLIDNIVKNQQISSHQIKLLSKINHQMNYDQLKVLLDYHHNLLQDQYLLKDLVNVLIRITNSKEIQVKIQQDNFAQIQIQELALICQDAVKLMNNVIKEGTVQESIEIFIDQPQEKQLKQTRFNQNLINLLKTNQAQNVESGLYFKFLSQLDKNIVKISSQQQLLEHSQMMRLSFDTLYNMDQEHKELDKVETRNKLTEKLIEVELLGNKYDYSNIFKLLQDNNHIQFSQIEYLEKQFNAKDSNTALFILHILSINTHNINYQLADKVEQYIQNTDEAQQEILPVVLNIVNHSHINLDLLQQFSQSQPLINLLCSYQQNSYSQMKVSILQNLLPHYKNKERLVNYDIGRTIMSIIEKSKLNLEINRNPLQIDKLTNNLVQSWQLVEQLCTENVLIDQLMNNNLKERMTQSLQIKQPSIQSQVSSLFTRLLDRYPQYVNQLSKLIYEPNFILNVKEPIHVDVIYSVLQQDISVDIDKVHTILQQILTISSIQQDQKYQQKINFIISLAKGSNDPYKLFQLFIQAIEIDPQQLLNEDYLALGISKLQQFNKESESNEQQYKNVMLILKCFNELDQIQLLYQKGLNHIAVELLIQNKGDKEMKKLVCELLLKFVKDVELKEKIRMDRYLLKDLGLMINGNKEDIELVNLELERVNLVINNEVVESQGGQTDLVSLVYEQVKLQNMSGQLFEFIYHLMNNSALQLSFFQDHILYPALESFLLLSPSTFSLHHASVLSKLTHLKQKDKLNKVSFNDTLLLDSTQSLILSLQSTNNHLFLNLLYQIQYNLVYNHKINALHLIKIPNMLNNHLQFLNNNINNHQILYSLCHLISSLGFKNKENKDILSNHNIIEHLNNVMINSNPVPKSLFKAISNNSQTEKNVATIIKSGLIEKLVEKVENDNLSAVLEIFSSVTTTYTKEQAYDMGIIIQCLLKQVQNNQQNSNTITKILNIMENLLKINQLKVTQLIVENNGINLIQTILKVQDNNYQIVNVAMRIIKYISSQDANNIELLIQQNIQNDFVNLLQIHKEEDNRLFKTILEILEDMIIDKKKCNQVFNSGIMQIMRVHLEEDNDIGEKIIERIYQMMKMSEHVSEECGVIIGQDLVNVMKLKAERKQKGLEVLMEMIQMMLDSNENNTQLMMQHELLHHINSLILADNLYHSNSTLLLTVLSVLEFIISTYSNFTEIKQQLIDQNIHHNLQNVLKNTTDQLIINKIQELINENFEQEQTQRRESRISINQRASIKMIIPIDIQKQKQEQIQTQYNICNVPQHILNYLLQGQVFELYRQQNGDKKLMHFFITPDFNEFICKKPKAKIVKFKYRMKLEKVYDVVIYNSQDQPEFKQSGFGKHTGLFKKVPNYENCISIIGPKDLKGIRQAFNLKSQNPQDINKLNSYLNIILKRDLNI